MQWMQDDKNNCTVITGLYKNLGWDDRIEELYCRPSIATNEEPSNATRICYS